MALHDMLSPREREVYKLMWKGVKYRRIGEILFISPYTVDGHAQSIFSKLGVHSRAEATHYADVHGLFNEIVETQVMQERQEMYSTGTLKGGTRVNRPQTSGPDRGHRQTNP